MIYAQAGVGAEVLIRVLSKVGKWMSWVSQKSVYDNQSHFLVENQIIDRSGGPWSRWWQQQQCHKNHMLIHLPWSGSWKVSLTVHLKNTGFFPRESRLHAAVFKHLVQNSSEWWLSSYFDPCIKNKTDEYACQSALFHFQALLLVILLFICTCTYVRAVAPRLVDRNKQGFVLFHSLSLFVQTNSTNMFIIDFRAFYSSLLGLVLLIPWSIRLHSHFILGERLSPYVALACIAMAAAILLA